MSEREGSKYTIRRPTLFVDLRTKLAYIWSYNRLCAYCELCSTFERHTAFKSHRTKEREITVHETEVTLNLNVKRWNRPSSTKVKSSSPMLVIQKVKSNSKLSLCQDYIG
jgi:hypothetical protein